MTKLTVQQILDAGLTDWRRLETALHARYAAPDYATVLAFAAAVGSAAEAADHHPEMTLSYRHVQLRLVSHDVDHVTERDVDLARTLTGLAAEHGLTAQPERLVEVEVALDTADMAALGPFWSVLLTGSVETFDEMDVVDPTLQAPTLWFQRTEPHEEPRQRFHLDVWLPHDVAEARIEAAVAAGGTVVDASHAPSFTVLADADGNKACVCTLLDRDD